MRSLQRSIVCLLLALASAWLSAQTPMLPTAITYDTAGNLYFADTNRNQIYESSLAGALTVIAGTGTQGFSGDGGSATTAALNAPQGLAIASNGTIYIADTGNHCIRAVISGTISTVAGTGLAGYSGDNGPAILASLNTPTALAIDTTGALLVADSNNHRIRRITAGQIVTIAGSGTQGFFGDNGLATSAQLDMPSGLAIATDGRIFLSDTHNDRIRVISTSGMITTFAGTGQRGYSGDGGAALAAQLALPRGLLYADGTLMVADSNNHRIRSVDASNTITTLAGNGLQGSSTDSTLATAASLNAPRAVAQSTFSAPVLADTANHIVRELLPNADLYAPAGLTPSRSSTVLLSVANAVYGQSQATISVAGTAGAPQGVVQVLEGSVILSQSKLTSGVTTVPLPTLTGGLHALTAIYDGDGVNPTAIASTTTTIARAPTFTYQQPISQNSYAGLPLVLSASVTSTGGTPTGAVTFLNGTSVIATATLSNGSASALFVTPPAGAIAITSSYAGDTNFAPSTSASVSTTLGSIPDFTLVTVGSNSQTVQGGSIVEYSFAVAPQPAPFTNAISFSVSGLQPGATATFSPTQVIPGSSSAMVTLSIQTVVLAHVSFPRGLSVFALLLPIVFLRRKRRCASLLLISACLGCGDRTLSTSQTARTFPITVTATSTNLAGVIVSHAVPVILSIR